MLDWNFSKNQTSFVQQNNVIQHDLIPFDQDLRVAIERKIWKCNIKH